MENLSPYILFGIGLGAFVIIGVLTLVNINKTEKINQLHRSFVKLKKSFNDLDEQAKLIVKTDLELNKAQEELDKRLEGLDALQKISRLISTTLDETEIFSRLHQALTTNLEFERNLIFIYNERQNLRCCVNIGFFDGNVSAIIDELENNPGIIDSLQKGQTFSSTNTEKAKRKIIAEIFNTEHFVFTPILSQKGIIGLVFVGNQSNAVAITQGDEEIISILANQIGQILENARLFEQVFRSRQILEAKVHDRTNQLESALAEVQNISKTKSEFISAVSHELRTPLTSIKGYASILMTGKLGDIPDQVKARLDKINTHSDNLVKLINELLDISRIESGRVEMKLTKCALADMVETIHDLLTPQMKDKNIQWSAQIDEAVSVLEKHYADFKRLIGELSQDEFDHGEIDTPQMGRVPRWRAAMLAVEHHVNHKAELFMYLKFMGVKVNTGHLYVGRR